MLFALLRGCPVLPGLSRLQRVCVQWTTINAFLASSTLHLSYLQIGDLFGCIQPWNPQLTPQQSCCGTGSPESLPFRQGIKSRNRIRNESPIEDGLFSWCPEPNELQRFHCPNRVCWVYSRSIVSCDWRVRAFLNSRQLFRRVWTRRESMEYQQDTWNQGEITDVHKYARCYIEAVFIFKR